jgi:hypothetical protein
MTSLDACAEYTNPESVQEQAIVVLRAWRKANSGTTRLRVQNLTSGVVEYDQSLVFQGDVKDEFDDQTDIVWEAGDRFDFAYEAGGMLSPHFLILQGSEGLIGTSAKELPGTTIDKLWGQPRIELDSASTSSAPGKGRHTIVVGNSISGATEGNGRALVWRNDVLNDDTDSDGLGDDLEAYLGTDELDPDTDQDGFTDALEVVGGAHHPLCAGSISEEGPDATDPTLGCAINLATFDAHPDTPTVFVTFLWMQDPDGSDPIGEYMADSLDNIRTAFAALSDPFGVAKPVMEFLADHGQDELGLFAAGGATIPYQAAFCMYADRHAWCDLENATPCAVDGDCNDSAGEVCFEGGCVNGLHCKGVCAVYDDEYSAPGGGDPHSPWNLNTLYWAADPLFPISRRGLSIPYVGIISDTLAEPEPWVGYAGLCMPAGSKLCQSSPHPGSRPIYPGVLLSMRSQLSNSLHTMHEIGHALRLHHSPSPDMANYQPNYVSVMNYSFDTLLHDYGHIRPDLAMLGEALPSVTTEEDCCCGLGCPSAWASDEVQPRCCWECGEFNSATEQCEFCPAAWLPTGLPGLSVCYVGPPGIAVPDLSLGESECCCDGGACEFEVQLSPKDDCPGFTSFVPGGGPLGDDVCLTCSLVWHEGTCYRGGLDEGEGIGANPDPPGWQGGSFHATLVGSILDLDPACCGPYLTQFGYLPDPLDPLDVAVAPSVNYPYNVDWNSSGKASELIPIPPEDRVFRQIGYSQGTLAESVLESIDGWTYVLDYLPTENHGTQGTGLPPFCDGPTWTCPTGTDCICGWCVAPGDAHPAACLGTSEEYDAEVYCE